MDFEIRFRFKNKRVKKFEKLSQKILRKRRDRQTVDDQRREENGTETKNIQEPNAPETI